MQFILETQAKLEAAIAEDSAANREGRKRHEEWLRAHDNKIDALTELVNSVARAELQLQKQVSALVAAINNMIAHDGHR